MSKQRDQQCGQERFRAKWSARRADWEKLGVLVSGAKMCEEFIADCENVLTSHDEAVPNTNQAAAMTGYSRAQLLHLYKQGKVRGHKNGKHVFFRAGDLPRKPNGGRPVVPASKGAPDEEARAGARRLAERLGLGRSNARSAALEYVRSECGCPCGPPSAGAGSLLCDRQDAPILVVLATGDVGVSIQYDDLDAEVRGRMLEELRLDQQTGKLSLSPRLSEQGLRDWPALVADAIKDRDDGWLEARLREQGRLRAYEQRRKPKGGFTQAKVPEKAAETLAEGEFNRFYARGLCVAVVAAGGDEVEVYRGKAVTTPRHESEAMLGKRLPARALLEDLRTHQGVDTVLGLPPGPNSGLTVRRPR